MGGAIGITWLRTGGLEGGINHGIHNFHLRSSQVRKWGKINSVKSLLLPAASRQQYWFDNT